MASRIAGITIEIDGNTTPLQKAIGEVNKSLKETQGNLRDIDKALKLDPNNLTLWESKQREVNNAIEACREKLDTLREAQSQYAEGTDEWNNLQTEIGLTEASLANYESQAEEASRMTAELGGDVSETGQSAEDASGDMSTLGKETKNAGEEAESASNGGWSVAKELLAEFAKQAIQAAIDGLKKLGGAMKDAVTDSAEFADEVLTLSTQTHLSTDTIQELYYATELMDVPVETVSKSLTKLTNTMADASVEGSSASEKFASMGISVQDTNGELRSAEAVFYDVIDYLGGIQNEAERDAVAYDLFGRSAKELNPLIEMGSEGFADLKQEAHDAGAVLDGEALGSLGDVSDAMERVDQATMVVQRNFAVALAPAISSVGEAFAQMSADADWQDIFSTLGDSVAEILPDLIGMAKTVLPALINIIRQIVPSVAQILSYLPQLQPVIDAIVMVVSRFTPIVMKLVSQLLPPLIDIIVAILPILEPILDLLEPLLDIIGPVLSVILSALSIALKALVQIIAGTVQPAIDGLRKVAEMVAPVFEKMSSTLQNVQHSMGNAWTAITNGATNAVNSIKNGVVNVWNSIKSTTTSVWNAIKSAIMTPINSAVSAVQTAVGKIKGFFANLSIKLPQIKLPHFNLTGKFSFVPPTVPKLSVEWYAKAMENGMIFNTPTLFGLNNGKGMVAGEAGAEALIGVNSLRDMITSAVGGSSIVVNVYGTEGQNVNELANLVAQKINNTITRRRGAYA